MLSWFEWAFSFPNIWFALGSGIIFSVGELASRWSGAAGDHPFASDEFFMVVDAGLLLACLGGLGVLLTYLDPGGGNVLVQLQTMTEGDSVAITTILMSVMLQVGVIMGVLGGVVWPLAIWMGGTEYHMHQRAFQAWEELEDPEKAAQWLDEHGVGLKPFMFAIVASLPLIWVWGELAFFGLSAGSGMVGILRAQLQYESTSWIVQKATELRKERLQQ